MQSSTNRMMTRKPPQLDHFADDQFETTLRLPRHAARIGEGGLRCQGLFKQAHAELPLVSLVTVVRNGDRHLAQTIKSVLDQEYDNIEYIVVDGASSDGSLEIIRHFEHGIDYWVSEPDRGISDAFNKGIRLSTGDWVGLINSDDWYELDAVPVVVEASSSADIVHGWTRKWFQSHHKIKRGYHPLCLWTGMCIQHPTVFVNRSLYKRVGLYSPDYQLAMDYQFLLRALTAGALFRKVNQVITNFRSGGVSFRQRDLAFEEELRAQREILFNPRWLFSLAHLTKSVIHRIGGSGC